MRRKVTKLDAIAEQLIKQKKGISIYPCEYSFISTATPLIWKEIKEWFDDSNLGLSAPTQEAIKKWFYQGCPDWAIATLFFKLEKDK